MRITILTVCLVCPLLCLPTLPIQRTSGQESDFAATNPAAAFRWQYQQPETVGQLACGEVCESSGLAASRNRPDVLWTHNDSGDRARLFAFDTAGRHVGTCVVEGARAKDWEDMASFELDGQSYLLIGDVGDNSSNRRTCQLYLVPEHFPPSDTLTVKQTVSFRFETGPGDCESLAFDPVTREVLLIHKNWIPGCPVFSLTWPEKSTDEVRVAKEIGRLQLAGVTGMDISPDGLRAIVLTYGNAFEYTRDPAESWAAALARPPRQIDMPVRKQGEAICYASDGHTLYLTSENRPVPLFRVTANHE